MRKEGWVRGDYNVGETYIIMSKTQLVGQLVAGGIITHLAGIAGSRNNDGTWTVEKILLLPS